MELTLTSNEHKIKDNCLRYTFQTPKYFENQYILLESMIFYNYFENITDKFKLTIKNKIQSHTINFKNGHYNILDISKIINNVIKKNFKNISEEKYIEIVKDVNTFSILIIVKKDWILELDENFMNLFGFEKNIFEEGYHRSNTLTNIDKTKFLKIYCNLVNNEYNNNFLTSVSFENDIGKKIVYKNNNYILNRKKILNTGYFYYIDVYIKNQNNEDVVMSGLFLINIFISG